MELVHVLGFTIPYAKPDEEALEVSSGPCHPYRPVHVAVFQPQHPSHRRSPWVTLPWRRIARADSCLLLASARHARPAGTVSQTNTGRRRLFRAIDLLPSIYRGHLYARPASHAGHIGFGGTSNTERGFCHDGPPDVDDPARWPSAFDRRRRRRPLDCLRSN